MAITSYEHRKIEQLRPLSEIVPDVRRRVGAGTEGSRIVAIRKDGEPAKIIETLPATQEGFAWSCRYDGDGQEFLKCPAHLDGFGFSLQALGLSECEFLSDFYPSSRQSENPFDTPRERPVRVRKDSGIIYFVRAAGTQFVKIGHSQGDLASRIATLQTGCPHELKALATVDGTQADESSLHRRFKHLAVRGEWFRMDEELKGFIAEIANV